MTRKQQGVLTVVIVLTIVLAIAFVFRLESEKNALDEIRFAQEWAQRPVEISLGSDSFVSQDPWSSLSTLMLKHVPPLDQAEDGSYAVTSTSGNVTVVYREDIVSDVVEGAPCKYYSRSITVRKPGSEKRFELGKASYGESELCRRDFPESRWTFLGIADDVNEAWIATVPPFPIGDALSGEIGVGDRILRVSLEHGGIKEWGIEPAFIQRADPKHGLVLAVNQVECPVKSEREMGGCYSVFNMFSGKWYPPPALGHTIREVEGRSSTWSVDVQTSFSADGKSIAFATITETRDSFGKAGYVPMRLWILDIATGKHREVTTGLGESDVFRVREWSGPRSVVIDYIDWKDEKQEIKSKTLRW